MPRRMVTFPGEEDVTTTANLWHKETLPQAVTLVNRGSVALSVSHVCDKLGGSLLNEARPGILSLPLVRTIVLRCDYEFTG